MIRITLYVQKILNEGLAKHPAKISLSFSGRLVSTFVKPNAARSDELVKYFLFVVYNCNRKSKLYKLNAITSRESFFFRLRSFFLYRVFCIKLSHVKLLKCMISSFNFPLKAFLNAFNLVLKLYSYERNIGT